MFTHSRLSSLSLASSYSIYLSFLRLFITVLINISTLNLLWKSLGMPLLFETDGKSVKLYHYVPSDVAAYIFMAVFGCAAMLHIFFMFQLRAKHFFLFVVACISKLCYSLCTFFTTYRISQWSVQATTGESGITTIPRTLAPFVYKEFLSLLHRYCLQQRYTWHSDESSER